MIARHRRRGRNDCWCKRWGDQRVIARDIRRGRNQSCVETGCRQRPIVRYRGRGSDHRIEPNSVPGVITNDIRSGRDQSRGEIRRRASRAHSFSRWRTRIRPDRQQVCHRIPRGRQLHVRRIDYNGRKRAAAGNLDGLCSVVGLPATGFARLKSILAPPMTAVMSPPRNSCELTLRSTPLQKANVPRRAETTIASRPPRRACRDD